MLIFGIDKFMSECRALVNFCGNAVATLFIGRWDKTLDVDRVRRVFNGEDVPPCAAAESAEGDPRHGNRPDTRTARRRAWQPRTFRRRTADPPRRDQRARYDTTRQTRHGRPRRGARGGRGTMKPLNILIAVGQVQGLAHGIGSRPLARNRPRRRFRPAAGHLPHPAPGRRRRRQRPGRPRRRLRAAQHPHRGPHRGTGRGHDRLQRLHRRRRGRHHLRTADAPARQAGPAGQQQRRLRAGHPRGAGAGAAADRPGPRRQRDHRRRGGHARRPRRPLPRRRREPARPHRRDPRGHRPDRHRAG